MLRHVIALTRCVIRTPVSYLIHPEEAHREHDEGGAISSGAMDTETLPVRAATNFWSVLSLMLSCALSILAIASWLVPICLATVACDMPRSRLSRTASLAMWKAISLSRSSWNTPLLYTSARGELEGRDRTSAWPNPVEDLPGSERFTGVFSVRLFADRMEVDEIFLFLSDIEVKPPAVWPALQKPDDIVLLNDSLFATVPVLQASSCLVVKTGHDYNDE